MEMSGNALEISEDSFKMSMSISLWKFLEFLELHRNIIIAWSIESKDKQDESPHFLRIWFKEKPFTCLSNIYQVYSGDHRDYEPICQSQSPIDILPL